MYVAVETCPSVQVERWKNRPICAIQTDLCKNYLCIPIYPYNFVCAACLPLLCPGQRKGFPPAGSPTLQWQVWSVRVRVENVRTSVGTSMRVSMECVDKYRASASVRAGVRASSGIMQGRVPTALVPSNVHHVHSPASHSDVQR